MNDNYTDTEIINCLCNLIGCRDIKIPFISRICFFDEIISFFNLVSSDLFSKLNFIKTGFYLLLKGTNLVM